ncbi:MAG: ATP:cob(I)alamin adenosyltransferase [Bacteroidetes bacterium GWC2_33_15]|nr:MAG: ATP:cob(I)alamin adenosyltransferase [Bacteroidetes bacterium GWA2_33_15]OFX50972.1 MAG: ATP:cob(I)alamin adenosyltransferase [Bacteroidetes bacterium GWC2_33_15]OFX66571.1 MAG: ATP:cob(I)alamin adenosyltransferase [Bacteroidetes bacterium GWB2_32_14]OFX70198.1 MAG: ATP:cob(I)alamin adenosyltransferase [Bacteroidetes bacterium GWD2_33_33]HAN20008.1 cob(I)yrinic acid a,c-diamide adenosyltransferase [Bacteroidales bacterium]
MKIYTKTGDKGETSLIGGTRVPKYHDRIEAYGTVDELISYIGLIRDQKIDSNTINTLIEIQDRLMTCASILATDCENCKVKIPELYDSDIEFIEKEIDKMEKDLPPLSSFILPGGHSTVSYCHIARNVCRRAERNSIKVQNQFKHSEKVIQYLNRLSDYLFVLSRKLSTDLFAREIPWKPRI